MGTVVRQVQSYDAETLEVGLLELARWRGNAKRASASLAERGIRIPWRTLYDWRHSHADRLADIEAEILPRIRDDLAIEQERIARRSGDATVKLIDRLVQEADKIPARDLASAVRNMEVTAATAIDKHSLLHGLPTEIRQNDSAEDVLKRLEQKHPQMFIDSTAEEMTDVEVVDGSPEGGAQRETRAALPEGHGSEGGAAG